MDYSLPPPFTGVSKFRLYRRSYDEEVTIDLPGDHNPNEWAVGKVGDTYIVLQHELLLWLRNVGWARPEKMVDLIWNFRVIACDIETQTFRIPDKQWHPEDEPPSSGFDPYGQIESFVVV